MEKEVKIQQILKAMPDLLDWQIEHLLDATLKAKEIASKHSKCRSCNALIVWGSTKNGKRCPLDMETGQPHLNTCPQAEEWKRYQEIKNSPNRSFFFGDKDIPMPSGK